jgi:glycosyltransferase involved in cell wall biosynthesis
MSRYDPAQVTPDAVAAVRRELGLADDRRLLTMVAEFLPRKGHRDAVAALARAGDARLVLACAGDGPMMADVRAEAERLGVSEQVRFLGFRNDIGTLLRASFALILPSKLEGLPRCIMEASCLERPTVAYRIRGVSELIDDGTGVLCQPGDVDALAAAIRRLADDPAAAQAMGVRARAKMDTFELGHLLELHDRLYARALEGRGGAAARAPAGG